MRDKNVLNIKKAFPRMSWSSKNLYLLWLRTAGPKSRDIQFRTASETLFAQRWKSKAAVRAYHGDHIPEKIFKRWYLPETLPDVRPKRAVQSGDDVEALEEFARRKTTEEKYHAEEEVKGMAPVGSLMFAEVERRIDVFLFRACFAHSVYEARRLVVHGYVKLNGKQHQNSNTRLAPGDMVSVDPEAITFLRSRPKGVKGYDAVNADANPQLKLTPFFLPHFAAPWLFVPAYIEANYATCSAIYVRHPTARPGYSEIPTPYEADGEVVRFAWEWYVMRKPRIRSESQISRMPEDRAFNREALHEEKERYIQRQAKARKEAGKKGMIL